MTVYSFDLLVGFEPNGVDVAQASRSKLLHSLGIESKFIFSYLPDIHQISYYTSLGIPIQDIIVAPLFLAGITDVVPSISVEDMVEKLNVSEFEVFQEYNRYSYTKENEQYILFTVGDNQVVYQVEYLVDGILLKRDVYSTVKMYSEYFTRTDELKKICRQYYQPDGRKSYEEIYRDDKQYFVIEGELFETYQEVLRRTYHKLGMSETDLIVMDRTTSFPFAQVLLEEFPQVPKTAIFHSNHGWLDEDSLYYEYYYLFECLSEFSCLIVSTSLQKQMIEEFIARNGFKSISCEVLPVGYLSELSYPKEDRKPYSMMIASRLVPGKGIDLAIKATARAKKLLPDLTLDIYGQGVLYQEFSMLIEKEAAGDFIRLRGYQQLDKVYPRYTAYLSTSWSESFGLSLLEATGSGLGLIGFDSRYGNTNFIKDRQNGVMISSGEEMTEEEQIEKLVKAICDFYTLDMEEVSKESYKISGQYTKDRVAANWQDVLDRWTNV